MALSQPDHAHGRQIKRQFQRQDVYQPLLLRLQRHALSHEAQACSLSHEGHGGQVRGGLNDVFRKVQTALVELLERPKPACAA